MPRGKENGLELLQLGFQKMFCATDREIGTHFCAACYYIYLSIYFSLISKPTHKYGLCSMNSV